MLWSCPKGSLRQDAIVISICGVPIYMLRPSSHKEGILGTESLLPFPIRRKQEIYLQGKTAINFSSSCNCNLYLLLRHKKTNLLYSGNHSKLAFFFLTLTRDECFFKFYVDLFLNKSFIVNINNLCMKSLGTLFVKFRFITIHTLFSYLKPFLTDIRI